MASEKRLVDARYLTSQMYLICEVCQTENIFIDAIIDEIDNAPDADAVEVVHGRWESNRWEYVCSCCQTPFTDELPWITHPDCRMPNYCPNCGAKMDGDGND